MKVPLLSEDEKRRIAIRIIAEGTTSVVSSMVDIVDPETAVELSRPYFEHAGLAAAALLKNNVIDSPLDDITTIQLMLTLTNHCFSNRGTRNSWVSEDVASCEVVDCTYSEGCPELCTIICDIGSNGVCKIINPAYEMKMLEMQTKGSPRCYWVVRRKGSSDTIVAPAGRRMLEPILKEEEMRVLQMRYIGEFWVLVTKGFLDIVEKRAAQRVLEPSMRLIGLRLGLSLQKAVKATIGLESASCLVRLVGDCFGQKCSAPTRNEGDFEWRVTMCPFTNAPEMLCRQVEAIYCGICSSLDPTFVFTTDMTGKGKEGCLCRIHNSGPSRLDRLWKC
jgi:hypothetical protein